MNGLSRLQYSQPPSRISPPPRCVSRPVAKPAPPQAPPAEAECTGNMRTLHRADIAGGIVLRPPTKKGCETRSPLMNNRIWRCLLALRELEAATRFRPAILLALNRPWIPRQIAEWLKNTTQAWLIVYQSARNSMTNRTSLTGQTRSFNCRNDIELGPAV